MGMWNTLKDTIVATISGLVSSAMFGKVTTPGDTAVIVDSAGRQIVVGPAADGAVVAGNPVLIAGQDGTNAQSLLTSAAGRPQVAFNTTATDSASSSVALVSDNADGARPIAAGNLLYNPGTNSFERARNVFAQTVLASAARTATVSTDITNHNGRSIAVILNITVAPNTASEITVAIRAKDSISNNYVTLLTSAAIVGSVVTGSVPVTNRYRVGPGITVVANVSAADILGRTLNVLVTHSNGDSWTYSVSADIGV